MQWPCEIIEPLVRYLLRLESAPAAGRHLGGPGHLRHLTKTTEIFSLKTLSSHLAIWHAYHRTVSLRRDQGRLLMALTILTVEEVAKLLHLHPITVYRLVKKGKLPAFKVGSRWRFRQNELEAWMAEQSRLNRLKR